MSLLASSAKAASFLTVPGAQQIRMIPFDEEFEFRRGRFMFNLNMLELPWMLGTEMVRAPERVQTLPEATGSN